MSLVTQAIFLCHWFGNSRLCCNLCAGIGLYPRQKQKGDCQPELYLCLRTEGGLSARALPVSQEHESYTNQPLATSLQEGGNHFCRLCNAGRKEIRNDLGCWCTSVIPAGRKRMRILGLGLAWDIQRSFLQKKKARVIRSVTTKGPMATVSFCNSLVTPPSSVRSCSSRLVGFSVVIGFVLPPP